MQAASPLVLPPQPSVTALPLEEALDLVKDAFAAATERRALHPPESSLQSRSTNAPFAFPPRTGTSIRGTRLRSWSSPRRGFGRSSCP